MPILRAFFIGQHSRLLPDRPRTTDRTVTEAMSWEVAYWGRAALWAVCLVAQAVYFARHIGEYGAAPLT